MTKEDNYWAFPLRIPDGTHWLFNDLIPRPWQCDRERRGWHPSLDLYETDEAFIFEADLPRVKPEDVQIEVVGPQLILRGRRIVQHSSADGRFHTMERLTGEFVRQLELTQSVSQEAIEVKFSDGVLRVIIGKLSSGIPEPPAG